MVASKKLDALGFLSMFATCFLEWFCDSLHSTLGRELVQRPQTLSVIFRNGATTSRDIFVSKTLCAVHWEMFLSSIRRVFFFLWQSCTMLLFAVLFITHPSLFKAASHVRRCITTINCLAWLTRSYASIILCDSMLYLSWILHPYQDFECDGCLSLCLHLHRVWWISSTQDWGIWSTWERIMRNQWLVSIAILS